MKYTKGNTQNKNCFHLTVAIYGITEEQGKRKQLREEDQVVVKGKLQEEDTKELHREALEAHGLMKVDRHH